METNTRIVYQQILRAGLPSLQQRRRTGMRCPMRKKKYDIFISYRRDGGAETAKHLRDILTAKGYSVFFDTDSLRNGTFNQELINVIRNCKDFILILSPNALDRCVNDGDWVRQEIACALESDKNIVPVMHKNFRFPEKLPDDIDNVRWKNGIAISIEFFDAMVEKLISFMLSKPAKRKVIHWLLPAAAVCVLAAAAAAIFLLPGGGNHQKETGTVLSEEYVQQLYNEGLSAYDAGDYLTALQRFEVTAEQGYASAQTELGYMYTNGLGVQKSYEKALEYYQAAAEQGNATALANLGFLYSNGYGVEKSYEKAIEYYQMAAEQGSDTGLFNLVYMYSKGLGVEQSDEKALEYYQKAADKGHAAALSNIGLMYSKGLVVEQSDEKAFEYYQKAAEKGYAAALYNIGILYSEGRGVEQSFEKAEEYFRKAADKGYTQAKTLLASWEKNGSPTPIPGKEPSATPEPQTTAAADTIAEEKLSGDNTESKAAKYLAKAEQGDAVAQFNLGYLYYKGSGVTQSYDKAVEYYQMAADQGHAPSLYNLGVMYQNGQGVERSYEKALEYYQKAADQGYANALSNLGVMYAKGQGVEQSYEKAVEYYRQAAEQGNATAQCNLGMMYYHGRGVEKSMEMAEKYVRMAAEQGNTAAMAVLDQWEEEGTLANQD